MSLRVRCLVVFTLLLTSAAVSVHAKERSGRKAFVSGWQDRTVVLKRTLYSVVFNERSRVLPLVKRRDQVSGLTVVTPGGMHYEFEARRDSEEHIVEADPDRIVAALQNQYYRSTHFQIGNVQEIEAVMLVRYEPGAEVVVRRVQIARDLVRLWLHKDGDADPATTVTVKWPAALSKDLTEAGLIDELFGQLVARM